MGNLLFAGEIHMVEQAKIDAARITQKSGNERRGAQSALANFSASLANSRRMDAAGSAVGDLSVNAARINDAAVNGDMSRKIAAAEELGTVAAMAGAAGVGGSSVQAYNETVMLSEAVAQQQADKNLTAQQWSIGEQKGNTIKAAVAGMDNSVYRADLDYKQYIDHQKPSFLARTLGLAATVAATVYAGPQAGAAAAGMFEAGVAGSNGDFAGATDSIMGSIQNAWGASKAYNATHGAPGATSSYAETKPKTDKYGRVISDPMAVTSNPAFMDSGSFFSRKPDYGSLILH